MLIQPSTFNRVSKAVLLSAILCGSAAATIENIGFSDTRGVSLGGATVASVDDAAAGLVNPAALGFMASKGGSDVDNNGLGEHAFGWNVVDIGMGATLTGDLGDYLEILGGIDFDNFETQLDQPGSVESLLSLAGVLGNVNDRDTIGSGQIQGAIDTLSSIIENSGGVGGLLSDNRTSITGRAFAAVEVPVSYGYAVNDNFSQGVPDLRRLTELLENEG
jgi:hypothetical protein